MATANDPIANILPTTGWLGDYMDFTSNLQACERFRFMTAACILGAIVSNRVYIYRSDPDLLPKLFPNIWIILIGPPGRGSKTSTINMAVNCLSESSDFARILADKLTPESLVKALSDTRVDRAGNIKIRDATGLIKAPEISVLFGKQQYNTGMIALIADLYDFRAEWSSETITRGKNVLYNNCISILAGSTPEWLQSQLPADAFTGGFMSRFVLVEMPMTYDRRVGWPKSSDYDGWNRLVYDLSKRENFKGEFQWTDEAKKRYINDYEKSTVSGDIQRDAYAVRYSEQVLKLAMVLALSDGKMTMELKYYINADKILKFLLPETFMRIEQLTTTPKMQLTQEIIALLKSFGTMSEKELMRRLYKKLNYGEIEFQQSLSVLKRGGIIDVVQNPTRSGKLQVVNLKYRLKEKQND